MLWIGAAILICGALAIRGYVLARGNFYWDDLVFFGKSARPLADLGAWFVDYDGHLMPGALFTAAAITKVAPLSWPAAAASLMILQFVASLTTLRALVIVAGRRPAVLLPFGFYQLSALTLPAMAWWASGLNALVLQIGLAVVVAETIRFVRGNRWSAAWALIGLAVALLFFEKSVVIPFVAIAAACLAVHVRGGSATSVLRRGRWLWTGYGLIVAGWVVLWLSLTSNRPGEHSIGFTVQMLYRSVTSVLAPAALGGPWTWLRRNPGPPLAVDNPVVTVVGVLAIVGIVGLTWRLTRRGAGVWAWVGLYFVGSAAAVFFLRSSEFTSTLLPLSLRYFADLGWVLSLGGALVLTAPRRAQAPTAWLNPRVVTALALVFAVSATVSSVRFAQVWADNPTGRYVSNLRAAAGEHAGASMLDQEINTDVLGRLAYPNNLLSRVLGAVPDRPKLSTTADESTVVDRQGRFVPGRVTRVRSVPLGEVPGCGTRIDGAQKLMPYAGPLAYWEWVVELNYLASADGVVVLSQEQVSVPVRVPVRKGAHTAYVRVPGAGDGLQARAETPGLLMCVGGGPVGLLIPASIPGP